MPNVATSRETIAEIRRLRKAGMVVADIARKLGVSAGVVHKYSGELAADVRGKKRQEIIDAVRAGWSFRKIIRVCGVAHQTVKKIIESMEADAEPAAAPFADEIDESDLPSLPESDAKDLPTFDIDGGGTWGIIGDIHIPYHHRPTLEAFVRDCRRRNVSGILLNGDTLDSHEVAFFDVEREAKKYKQELETCKEFLAWLRARFPRKRIVWKDGNHEERVGRYCLRRAPAISDIHCVNLPSFVELDKFGAEYVTDKRIIMLGQLPVIHGHEYRGGVSTPVNAARGVFLKAKDSCLTNHFHSSSMHPETTIKGKEMVVWSVGCACGLQPRYNPHGGRWNHGYCFVELDKEGGFAVDNRRVLRSGKVV